MTRIALLALAGLYLMSPGTLLANPDHVFECRSDGLRVECPLPFEGRVELLQTFSRPPCDEGRTWGQERDRVWTFGGCAGRFALYRVQARQPTGIASGTITCRSERNRLESCAVPANWQGARIAQQNSRTRCVQGENWGFDERGIWVDQGCSARFIPGDHGEGYSRGPDINTGVRPPTGTLPPPQRHPQAQPQQPDYARTVECRSNDYRYQRCDLPGNWRSVELEEQLSRSRCVEGDTWGLDRQGLWVDKGCAARFVEAVAAAPGQVIRCESRSDAYTHCPADLRRANVYLQEQRSSSDCIEGRTWGVDNRGIWVDRGCRADFEIVQGGRGRW